MKRIVTLLLGASLLLLPVYAHAQDSTPEPEPTAEVTPVPEPPLDLFPDAPTTDQAGSSLLAVIQELVVWASGLGVTVAIVSLLKRISLFDPIPAKTLNFAVAVVITILVWVSRRYSFEPQLFQGLEFLGGFLALILNMLSTSIGSATVYTVAKATNAPLISYQRV